MTVPDAIQSAMDRAVQDRVFPGAVLAVRQGGEMRCVVVAGRLSTEPPGDTVQSSTIYDLASLTKPLVTVTCLVLLIQNGELQLDAPIGSILMELEGAPIGSVSLRELLTHSSGLPGWRPIYEKLESDGSSRDRRELESTKQTVLQLIRDEPLTYVPGERSLYSDLGFILLGLTVERISGLSLDQHYDKNVAGPLGARPLLFTPIPAGTDQVMSSSVDIAVIAPTEWDGWRRRLLRGEVHDENAAAMGGVAGHAGLFGTAESVLAVAGAWIEAHCGRSSILDRDLVREFSRRTTLVPKSSWALGWDTPTAPSSSGKYFSASSFGHLGYTGTSLWIDPLRELEVVLLSNRVHPTRKNDRIYSFRPAIHDLVFAEFAPHG